MWQTITGAQRTAWDTYAALPAQELTNSLGEAYYVSGFDWFVSCNTHLEEAGDAAISAAPVLAVPATTMLVSYVPKATGAASSTRCGFNAASPTLTMKKAVWQVVGSSVGRTVAPYRYRLMTIEAPSGVNINFQTETEAVFGTSQAGQRGYLLVQNQNSEGRRGPFSGFSNIEFTTP
jgi:hypothetical protein